MSDNTASDTAEPVARAEIEVTVNGEERHVEVPPSRTLVEMLRDDLDMNGTTEGCGVGVCGSCTVLVDGDMVSSCLELAVNVDGSEVRTVEGLADAHDGEGLHPLQEAFQDEESFQCAYCTPGILMSSAALLEENPDPSREEIEEQLSENICRCTGYESILQGVSEGADRLNGD
jgi:carbon-monoxide dehydrogenase small subunit